MKVIKYKKLAGGRYKVYLEDSHELLYANILDKTVEEKTRVYKKLQNEKQS